METNRKYKDTVFTSLFNDRENVKNGMNRDEAIKKAVKDCIHDDVLRAYLEKNGSEVNGMMLTEFDMETAKEVWREEGIEEGSMLTTYRLTKEMLEEGLSIKQICKITKLDESIVTKIKNGTFFTANV